MRFSIAVTTFLATVAVLASSICLGQETAVPQLSVALGGSVPKDNSGQTLVEKNGPSRKGEHIIVRLSRAKMITDIKISGFSTSHSGKTLIHSATAYNGTTAVPIDALSQFAKITAGNPQNYQNLVMLPDSTDVEVSPNQEFSALDLFVEGFTNNDSSILLQLTANDGFVAQDFLVTRTGDTETVGGYINESNYAKFSSSDLYRLMTVAAEPKVEDLANKTFSCSSYTRLNPAQINFKTRAYTVSPSGALESTSSAEGTNLVWSVSADGLEMPIDNYNGCGKYTTYNVVRRTGGGNLISEVVLDLNSYVQLCVKAGYDESGTVAVENNSTFPSALNSTYVVDSYEFCHP